MTATSVIIDKATDITMDAFIDVMVEGKFELLIKEGEATQEELQAAWSKIYSEYLNAMGSDDHIELLNILRDINILSWQHQRITILLQVLAVCHVPAAVDELKKLGYSIKYDPKDLNRYTRDLRAAYEKSKTLLVRISIKQKELEELNNKNQSKAISRADFQTMLLSLSEYAKYQVHPAQITAYQFAVMMKKCNEYARSLERQLNKGRGSWQKN